MRKVRRMMRWWVGAVVAGLAASIAAAGQVPERKADPPVGLYLALALIFGNWHSNGAVKIRKSPLPITVVPVGKNNSLKGTALRISSYHIRIPPGSSVRVDLSEGMHLRRQSAADISYLLHGHKKVVKLWFHATKKNKVPLVPKGDVMLLGVDGGGYKPGYPKPVPRLQVPPGLPPPGFRAGGLKTSMKTENAGYIWWYSRFVPIPVGATDITLHCSGKAVPASGYDLRIWSAEFAGGHMVVSLSKNRFSSYPDTQYYILQLARGTNKHRSAGAISAVHMMMAGMLEDGYTPSAAKKMIIAALTSLTRDSGYDLEVAGFAACAEDLAKIRNPMAALRMAWLTEQSLCLACRVAKIELPDGEVAFYEGYANVWHPGRGFMLNRFDVHHRYLRSWIGSMVFPQWHHGSKAEFKTLALAAQVVASIRHVKQ